MPYKPTGRPPGRPRKHPITVPAVAQQEPSAEPAYVPPKQRQRARKTFRAIAETLNPVPFVQVFDSRGRPRHKPSQARRMA